MAELTPHPEISGCGVMCPIMIQFPHNFFWGAATSAYQVEGNNRNADWWEWEKSSGVQPSGQASRHYELYRQDFDLARELNHNAHRLSIEWSRIEPQEGEFSQKELEHYQEVILSLKERNIEPIVSLHHFTNPIWFAKLGGWAGRDADKYFLRFAQKVVDTLADKVRFWVTINEPMVYMYYSYILGDWPPQEKSYSKARRVKDNLAIAHVKAHRIIHEIYKKKNLAPCYVSIAQNMQAFVPCQPSLKNRLAVFLRDRQFNFSFLERLIRCNSLDFIGVNYYTRQLVDAESWSFKSLMLDTCKKNHHPLRKNSMGWDIYPQGLFDLLIRLKKYKLPVFILENGICTGNDFLRWDFIAEHLKKLKDAMDQGVNCLGYIYWSLLDNFEWDKGFAPRFGLIEVDYNTCSRKIRESARNFAQVAKTGRL